MKRLIIQLLLLVICGAKVFGQSNPTRHPAEPEMVFVEGGTFMMGCTSEQGRDCRNNERPQHNVTVSSFNIGKYEVTQRQWSLLMGNNPPVTQKGDDYPVDNVSWDNVQEFIRLLNAATGKNYRLPTEAEWEYAARGGAKSKGYKYSGSNKLSDVAWGEDYAREDGYKGGSKHPVGTKKPNELGIYDMSGNVYEWCNDWFDEYPALPQRDPKGAVSGAYRIMRGGAWLSDAEQCRITYRSYSNPSISFKSNGFRLALSSEK